MRTRALGGQCWYVPYSATRVLDGSCWKTVLEAPGSCSVRGNPEGQRRGRGPQKAPPASSVNCLLGQEIHTWGLAPPL